MDIQQPLGVLVDPDVPQSMRAELESIEQAVRVFVGGVSLPTFPVILQLNFRGTFRTLPIGAIPDSAIFCHFFSNWGRVAARIDPEIPQSLVLVAEDWLRLSDHQESLLLIGLDYVRIKSACLAIPIKRDKENRIILEGISELRPGESYILPLLSFISGYHTVLDALQQKAANAGEEGVKVM